MTRWPRNRTEENRIRRKKRRRESGSKEHRNYVSGKNEDSTPRAPIVLCKVCCGQPWRRDGSCCGPPALERNVGSWPAIRSSAGIALERL